MHFSTVFDIYLFTRSSDLNSQKDYDNIPLNTWHRFDEKFDVYYCSEKNLTFKNIHHQITNTKPDYLYLNSFFSIYFTLIPLLITKYYTPQIVSILAPRGMLFESALANKKVKKQIYLTVFKKFFGAAKIKYHATSMTESKAIFSHLGKEAINAPDLPNLNLVDMYNEKEKKDTLEIIYFSRIHPIKGLDQLLKSVIKINFNCIIKIYGTIEHREYWEECQRLINVLPPNIRVAYFGEYQETEIPYITKNADLFVLPTKGENFGHAIFEALSQSCPVMIGNNTPFDCVHSRKAGWLCSQITDYTNALNKLYRMSQVEYQEYRKNAFLIAQEMAQDNSYRQFYKNLFS